MIRPSTAISGGFTWSTLPHNQGDELKRSDQTVGMLRRCSIWSSDHVASIADGNWTFRRCGFFGAAAEIVNSDSQQQIAVFQSTWSGRGTLTFSDGRVFHLECKGWWNPVWNVTNDQGERIISLHIREKTVDLPATRSVSEERLSLLIMFALYRVRQAEEDVASSAMVSVVAVT